MVDENFWHVCRKKVPKIKRDCVNRRIYIWGAGEAGEVIETVMKENGIKLDGFIDQRAGEMREYLGYEVKPAAEMNPQTEYIVVGLSYIQPQILQMLDQMGYTQFDCCYFMAGEGILREDIIYRGCRVGRYTYGYEGLLACYPIASEIGRFCSINDTARIWNNHPMDYITTHPLLDHASYFEWDHWDQRKALIQKYGRYDENAPYEDSRLRNNKLVVIGNDVWIGANVVILPGVKIGNGAVLAAGAVVSKDIEAYAVAGGVPAETIKYRFPEEIRMKMQEIQWWNWSIQKIEDHIELFYQPEEFCKKFSKNGCLR